MIKKELEVIFLSKYALEWSFLGEKGASKGVRSVEVWPKLNSTKKTLNPPLLFVEFKGELGMNTRTAKGCFFKLNADS